MPETLVIRLPENLSSDACWAVIDDDGTRIGNVDRGALANAAGLQDQRKVVVLVPGTQAVCTRTQLPVKSMSKMLQVVPFALEEQLAGDVTRMHFAVGDRSDDSEVAVVAVLREHMQDWVDALAAADIHPSRLIPDSAGMPATDAGFTVLLDEREACIRDPDGIACFVDLESLVDTLELMCTPAEDVSEEAASVEHDEPVEAAPMPIHVFFDDSVRIDSLLETIKSRLPQTQFRRLPTGTFPRLAAEALSSPMPSLLQGEFSSRGRMDKYWRPWRTAASLAAMLVFATVAVKAAELITYKNRYDGLRAQMSELYQSKVPGAAADEPDPYGSLRRQLGGSGTETASDFLDGLSVLATSLEGDKTFLEGISFSNGQMSLEVIAPNVPTLDALRASISGKEGWQATLTQTREKDDVVEGRLQLQRATP